MIETIDKFFRWLKSAIFVSDLIIRLIVVIIVGGLSILLWFISVPIFAWYLYKKFGNARVQGCRCSSCKTINDCNDNFCIKCGMPMNKTYENPTYNDSKQQTDNSCKCSNCNSENDCNDNFCINCGLSLNSTNDQKSHEKHNDSGCECSQCNSLNSCDDTFCTKCGNKLDNINPKTYRDIFNSTDGILIALLSKIAKIDGRISQEEASYLSSVFDMLAEKRDDSLEAKNIYKEIL